MAKKPKKPKYPKKIEAVINLLLEQGYFQKEKEIVNIALLEYFNDKGFFKALEFTKVEEEE